MELLKKFNSLFNTPDHMYVNAGDVLKEYKKTKGHSGATQARMIHDMQIKDYIVIGRRGKIARQVINLKIDNDAFNYTTMNIFIDINAIKGNDDLVKRIKALPDVLEDNVEIQYGEAPPQLRTEPPAQVTGETETVNEKSNVFNPPVLELQEHEKFKDVDGDVFDIEVRGSYSRDGIYFKAKDIERYFGMDRMTERMLRTDQSEQYVLGADYVIIEDQTFPPIGGKSSSVIKREGLNVPPIRGEIKREGLNVGPSGTEIKSTNVFNRDRVFLTLNGLLQVIFTSKSGNANKDAMHDWIIGLVYKHKFGSKTERVELAKELTKDFSKHMLNKSISGLYYVDIGELNDLYDTMQISRETYPPEAFGNYHIAKFGLGEDIFSRVKDHKNAKSGYARWSKSVEHKWSVMVSPSQLSGAEKHLKTMLKANGFTFDYTDPFDKKHIELVMVAPMDEPKLKGIYRDLLKLFPSKENELAEALSSAEERHNLSLMSLKLDYERKLRKAENRANESELVAKDAHLSMKDETIARKEAEHQATILGYQLQIERMKNGAI
jgi:hypothetical protein